MDYTELTRAEREAGVRNALHLLEAEHWRLSLQAEVTMDGPSDIEQRLSEAQDRIVEARKNYADILDSE